MKSSIKTILICLLFVCTLQPNFGMVSAQGDPWLSGWNYRMEILATGSAGAGTDYQVFINVTYNANMQTDFDDIVFTDNDAITLLDFWLEEKYDSSFGLFWVEIADSLESSASFFMYWGNSTVSTLSNGENTFLFYEDWSEQAINASRWDFVTGDGTSTYSSTDANHGYVMRAVGSAPSSIYHMESDSDSLAPTALIFRSHIELTTNVNHRRLRQGMGSAVAIAYVASNQGTNQFTVTDDDANDDSQLMSPSYFDSYWRFEITRDGTNAKLYANHTLIETGSADPDIVSRPLSFIYVRDTEYALYSDWIVGRKFVAVEPEIFIGEWNSINDPAEIIFNVTWHPVATFGYEAILIFLGLIMIPLSTMYLVKGGREELSSDKVFYFLILFMLGWGFFIGGIT